MRDYVWNDQKVRMSFSWLISGHFNPSSFDDC